MSRDHSWGVVNSNLAIAALGLGKKISINPSCEYNTKQDILNKYIKYYIGREDMHVSYTNPHNFESFFKGSKGFIAGMCNYETDTIPDFWSSCQSFVDKVFVNSHYCKENFVRGGFASDVIEVVPLASSLRLTKPMFKNNMFNFLNVSSNHSRKRLDQVVRCFYKAFWNKDDVCLTIKTSKISRSHFAVDIYEILREQQAAMPTSFGKPPRIQIILDYMEDMSPLFSSCDALVSCSASEGFGLPLLEAYCLGMEVICPNYSGQKDFLTESESFLLKAVEVSAPSSMQYWKYSKNAKVCSVNDDDVVDAMVSAYSGRKRNKSLNRNYSWEKTLSKVCSFA